MTNHQTQKGFTLVELAIVMTIIGLLIGGILKGQELMQNARLTATIAQVRAYEAAVTTFRDKYNTVPGDMADASTRIPSCTAACNPVANIPAGTNSAPNDSLVGGPNWAGVGGVPAWGIQSSPATVLGTNETELFWVHLLLADLISGVTQNHLTGAAPAAGTTHPAGKINGVFIVGNGNGHTTPGNPTASATVGPSGMLLGLVLDPAAVMPATGTGSGPLTPTRAAQIDRKMDDGRPNGGYVQATGVAASCFSVAAPFSATAPGYLENVTSNDCGLVFRIQG